MGSNITQGVHIVHVFITTIIPHNPQGLLPQDRADSEYLAKKRREKFPLKSIETFFFCGPVLREHSSVWSTNKTHSLGISA